MIINMFEYKCKLVEGSKVPLEFVTNDLAKDGWRVCKILKRSSGASFDWYNIVFEREVK